MTDSLLWFAPLVAGGIAVFVALTLDLIDTLRGKPSIFDPPVIVYLKTSPMLSGQFWPKSARKRGDHRE